MKILFNCCVMKILFFGWSDLPRSFCHAELTFFCFSKSGLPRDFCRAENVGILHEEEKITEDETEVSMYMCVNVLYSIQTDLT